MRKFIAVLLTLCMVLTLCACGKKEQETKERDCGVYITVNAKDVYTVSCGTESGSESGKHADGSAINAGEVFHFDIGGEAAEGKDKAEISYTISVFDKDLNVLATNSFTSDFSNMAKINLVVTEDHRIVNKDDKLAAGGDTVVTFETKKPETGVSYAVPTVTMPNRTEAADKINKSIESVNKSFLGDQLESSKKAYNQLAEGEDEDNLDPFSQNRYVRVTRGDSAVLSFRMYDKANLGAGSASAITGHNYNSQTGAELKLTDLASDKEKLLNTCTEDIFNTLHDDEKFEDMLFAEGYTDKVKKLVSDGHWYLSNSGLVIAINAGEIASVDKGAFEFTVKYSELTDCMKSELLPPELEGDMGEISVSLAKNTALDGLTVIGKEANKDSNGCYVITEGNIYCVTVYSAKTDTSNGKYSLENQLFYCTDLSEGSAFAINTALKSTPNLFVGFYRPDGTYERRLLSLDSDGAVKITDPDGGETGTDITSKLPYSADLNNDSVTEKILTTTNDKGERVVNVETQGKTYTCDTPIKEISSIRLYDINSDKTSEIFLDGKDKDGNTVTCSISFNGELKINKFADKDYAYGAVKEFAQNTVKLKKNVSILGAYTAEVQYKFANGSFSSASGTMKLSGTSYVTTSKDITLADSSILPSGTKIKFTETDGKSYISYITEGGLTGKIKITKADSGWNINGNADTSYFSSLPYKK